MNRPAHSSDADWAEYQQCQAEHDGLMAQVAAREAPRLSCRRTAAAHALMPQDLAAPSSRTS